MSQAARGTIALEAGRVLAQEAHPAGQYVLRIAAPVCAARATAGSFVHLQCAADLPMRRPLSIYRRDTDAGWIEVLYKVVGEGTAALAQRRNGESLSVLGPIGRGFTPVAGRPRALLLGGGVGIPPLVFLALQLRKDDPRSRPLAIFGSEIPFPFELAAAPRAVAFMPATATAGMTLLEDAGVDVRLASRAGITGCFDGFVTDLARLWLEAQEGAPLRDLAVYACGPHGMLEAVAALCREFNLPCQVSLEEYMACAVGGCAGCTVRVQTDAGPAMKRVCVDGPVFEAQTVFG
ncbi:MAG: dihydroorotate dehydrogenase electron transfer subunit [Steroidobacteraceae bacterium]